MPRWPTKTTVLSPIPGNNKMLCLTLLTTLSALFASAQQYSLTETGGRNTLDYRLHLNVDGKPASFWHDVALYPDARNTSIVNFVVEIARWEDGKIEIRRDEPLNPIFHDDNDEGPRFVESVWPHRSYPFLYGSIPQTWETPNKNHSFTGLPGDNDPVDAVDIGQDIGYVGQVKQVKIIGGLAVIDGDETDWKILVIDVNDPLAPYINEIQDLDRCRPGVAESYRQWFRYYLDENEELIVLPGDYAPPEED
ncbi:Putative inorganic pyrophosphatase [Septoria linicola]|uniref:inorganic diphosphatase n=1 Tax=Septoria linicola TaxID=215465 RepID=A0A9Q9B0A0_9PEZI|nr:Putative inorganic pyrophosphatase [Septoria linicola]